MISLILFVVCAFSCIQTYRHTGPIAARAKEGKDEEKTSTDK